MENTINRAVFTKYGTSPRSLKGLGGGFYGRAFLVESDTPPYTVVAKLYLYPGIAEREARQIKELSAHGTLKMPEIYGVLKSDENGLDYDVLFMEYINGVNASEVSCAELSENIKNDISDKIVENLIAYHSTVSKEGFGDLCSEKRFSSWQEYYYPIAENIVKKAKELHSIGQINDYVLSVFERSIEAFHSIFRFPITEARLIHGDYNMWNIMLNESRNKAYAVIDPFNCCYADSEYDLYQLDNANGKDYGLLTKYCEKVKVSKNFIEKRRFYELYSEVNHYYDAHVEVYLPAVEKLAQLLDEVIKKHL